MASLRCMSIAAKPAIGGAATLKHTVQRSAKPAAAVRVRRAVIVAKAAEEEEVETFTAPTLNPDTPSPIFGGSTVLDLIIFQLSGR